MPKVATSFPHLPCCDATTQKSQKIRSTEKIGLGKKQPTMDKLVQLIGIVFLYGVGLSGSDDILGKKRA
jgi:hypothetical protein